MNDKKEILIKILKIILLFVIIIFSCMSKGQAVEDTVLSDIEYNLMKKYCESPKVDKNGQPQNWNENTKVTIKKSKIPKSKNSKDKLLKEIKSKLTYFTSDTDKTMIHYKFLNALQTAVGEVDDTKYDKNKIKEMEDWDYDKIEKFLKDGKNNTKNIQGDEFANLRTKWAQKIAKEPNKSDAEKKLLTDRLNGSTLEEAKDAASEPEQPSGKYIYLAPEIKGGGTEALALDDMIEDADKFVSRGSNSEEIKQEELQDMASSIYSIVVQIGVAIAVIIGLILGIKFMMSGIDGKADVKKMIATYIAGCVIVFGAFAIWKVVVLIIQKL